MTYLGNLRDFFGRLRISYSDWQLVDIDGRPLGVAVQQEILVIGTDGIFSEQGPELIYSLVLLMLGHEYPDVLTCLFQVALPGIFRT